MLPASLAATVRGNRHGDAHAAAVQPGAPLDPRAVLGGDLRHQRQADAAAALDRAGLAVEAVEHAFAFGGRDAWPVVGHGQLRAAVR
ncbi:hypothetical protein G6F62_014381 [Rhizopus arrhizus]|nr:hypothetical protein G6F62_014381 [Rhizopus arrhizus]